MRNRQVYSPNRPSHRKLTPSYARDRILAIHDADPMALRRLIASLTPRIQRIFRNHGPRSTHGARTASVGILNPFEKPESLLAELLIRFSEKKYLRLAHYDELVRAQDFRGESTNGKPRPGFITFAQYLVQPDFVEDIFLAEHIDAATVDHCRELVRHIGTPEGRRGTRLYELYQAASSAVCRDICQLIEGDVFRNANAFEVHLLENKYHQPLNRALDEYTDPALKERLLLHLNRSLFEACYCDAVINSQEKFEKWTDLEIYYLRKSLRKPDPGWRGERGLVRYDGLESGESDSHTYIQSVQHYDPFETNHHILNRCLRDELEKRILILRYEEGYTEQEIAVILNAQTKGASRKWSRERVARVSHRALMAILETMVKEDPTVGPRPAKMAYGMEIPVLFIDCLPLNAPECVFLLTAILPDGRRQLLPRRPGRDIGDVFAWLRAQGIRGVRLVVSDYYDGLLPSLVEVCPDARWQFSHRHLHLRFNNHKGTRRDLHCDERHALLHLAAWSSLAQTRSNLPSEALVHCLTVFQFCVERRTRKDALVAASAKVRGCYASTPLIEGLRTICIESGADQSKLLEKLDIFINCITAKFRAGNRWPLPVFGSMC